MAFFALQILDLIKLKIMFIRRLLIFLIPSLIVLISFTVFAQAYEGTACGNGNPSLKRMFKKGDLSGLSLEEGVTGAWNHWSSSILKNTATLPPTYAGL